MRKRTTKKEAGSEKAVIKVVDYNIERISREDVIAIAFDARTDDRIARQYYECLLHSRWLANKIGADWDRFIFYINPETKFIQHYFD